jgi:hypothetical protein
MKLIEESRIDAVASLVAGPEAIAERFDDVIGGDTDMRRATVDHPENGADDAADRGDLPSVRVTSGRECVEVPE